MPRGQLTIEDRLHIRVTKLTKSVERLRHLIQTLRSELKSKDRAIHELELKLEEKESQRKELAGYLYKQNHSSRDKKPLGKKPGSPAFHRPKPQENEVTQTLSFPLSECPACNHALGKTAEETVRYEEDIDLAPKKIIKKYIIERYWCSFCRDFVKSPRVPPIRRIGPNVLGYILYARYRLRLPQEKIKESLSDLHNFRISEGEIAEKLKEAEELFGKEYESIIALIRSARIVYADETGWRMDGENWWLWVFVTDTGVRYLLEMSRGKGVPEQALGTKKDRVIISDGYAVYAKLPGENQQCWVHLLRSARNASELLYQDLVALYVKLGEELTKPMQNRARAFLTGELKRISEKTYQEHRAKKVQARIKKHQDRLFTCLRYDGVLPENNTAERALRHQVVMRKIFGGCRSPDGARAHEVNTSVLETLKKQNPTRSFFEVVLPLLKKRIEERHSGL